MFGNIFSNNMFTEFLSSSPLLTRLLINHIATILKHRHIQREIHTTRTTLYTDREIIDITGLNPYQQPSDGFSILNNHYT